MPGGQQQPVQNTVSNTGSNVSGASTTTQELAPEQRKLLDMAMPGFQQFAAFTPQRYQGPTTAGFDPSQTSGQNMALGAAGGQQTLADNAAGTSNFYLGGDVWNPGSNPALQGTIDAATRPIMQNFNEQIMPSIRGESIKTGGFGGSRQGVAEGIASRGVSQAVGDTSAKITTDLYRTNVEAQLRALGLLPQTQAAQVAPALTTSGVGDVRQTMSQSLLNEQAGNFGQDEMMRLAPFLQSRELLAILQGIPGSSVSTSGYGTSANTGTGTSTANVPKANPLSQALGGAASGAAIGSMFGPIGTGVGAAGGAVLPFIFQ